MADVLGTKPMTFMIPREYIGSQPIVDYFYADLDLSTFDNVFAAANSHASGQFCIRGFKFKVHDAVGSDLKFFGEYSDSGGPRLVFKLDLAEFPNDMVRLLKIGMTPNVYNPNVSIVRTNYIMCANFGIYWWATA